VVDQLEELEAIDEGEVIVITTRGKVWRSDKVSFVGIRDLRYFDYQTVT
jgi:hypothetical protein